MKEKQDMKATQPLQDRDSISKIAIKCDFMRKKEELPDKKIRQKPTASPSPHQINSLFTDPLMSEFLDTVVLVLFCLFSLILVN